MKSTASKEAINAIRLINREFSNRYGCVLIRLKEREKYGRTIDKAFRPNIECLENQVSKLKGELAMLNPHNEWLYKPTSYFTK